MLLFEVGGSSLQWFEGKMNLLTGMWVIASLLSPSPNTHETPTIVEGNRMWRGTIIDRYDVPVSV